MRRFLDDPSQLISAALVGTNICVVLSTVVATLALLPRFPRHAELFSLALVTPLVLVFGEIVPKSIFQHHANRWAPTLISILSWFRLAFLPVVVLGSRFSSMLLRIFGVRESQGFVGREELRLLITLPSRIGEDSISIQEKQMISRIFAFSETEVEEVMVPLSEVTALPILSSLEDVAREIADKAHTRIPVYSERVDQIVGIVHAFDVLRAEPFVDVETISWPPIFVPESQLAVDTLVRLKREGQGMAVVVDEYGGATGVVTVEDIIEEIVGEIQDEYDEEGGLVRAGPDGTTLAAGRASVESVNALADLDLPIQAEDYETIAGLVLERAKKIPKEGARFAIAGVTITVTKATERSIEEVRIRQEGKGRGQ
ncbi:MAG: HlyC/CorC family transporter [Deltaproteobacteria bacterium]|nr:HlyC/CorC family transporter [Deltaproteobacteria bacterium]